MDVQADMAPWILPGRLIGRRSRQRAGGQILFRNVIPSGGERLGGGVARGRRRLGLRRRRDSHVARCCRGRCRSHGRATRAAVGGGRLVSVSASSHKQGASQQRQRQQSVPHRFSFHDGTENCNIMIPIVVQILNLASIFFIHCLDIACNFPMLFHYTYGGC